MTTRTALPAAGDRWHAARVLLAGAVARGVAPAAVIEVGGRSGPRWSEPFGRLTFDADAPACRPDTIFDLASLTKVIATVPLVMQAIRDGAVDLDTPIESVVPAWHGPERAGATIRHLLDHSSGLPAHAHLWKKLTRRDEVEAAIAAAPLDRAPASAAVYSDLGFILLGFILERLAGRRLDDLFVPFGRTLGDTLGFLPGARLRPRIAPAGHDPWRGRLLVGEAHDENAALCEGVAGHAGLFGTAAEVGAYARLVLETFDGPTRLGSPLLMLDFAGRSRVRGSSRALGWDTMLPTSSCGTRMSERAIGHTGFTGTSLWIDPARDVYVVLLTNRVHPTRDNEQLQGLRPRVHDAVMAGGGG